MTVEWTVTDVGSEVQQNKYNELATEILNDRKCIIIECDLAFIKQPKLTTSFANK